MLVKEASMVLQGGGALGAYQAGVYQALHEAGIEPDWIIGTSIGAINARPLAPLAEIGKCERKGRGHAKTLRDTQASKHRDIGGKG
jgi:NTE family protein